MLQIIGYLICKIVLDESTDIQDGPQLAIFIRYVHPAENVKEEMLDLVALIETTHGIDIRYVLDNVMNRFKLPPNKHVNLVTDGASAMMGKTLGLIGLLNNDPKISRFFTPSLHNSS